MFLSAEPSYRSHRVVCILTVDLLLIWLSFGTLVSFFFFVVFDTNNFFYCVCNLRNIRQGERDGRVRRRKRAQTTHRHEVWLQVTFFISLFNIYVLLHATFNLQNERWEAATTRKGTRWMLFFPLCPILQYYLSYHIIYLMNIFLSYCWVPFGRTWEGSIKYLF